MSSVSEAVADRARTLAQRLVESGGDAPASMTRVLALADEVTRDDAFVVLAGLMAVLPPVAPAGTNRAYADLLRKAVSE